MVQIVSDILAKQQYLVNSWWLMCANCSLLWFQITFWQLQLDRHRLKMSKVAERWAMFFVSLFSLAIDLFIEPLNGLTRCGIKSSDDLEEWLGPDSAFSECPRWWYQIQYGTQSVDLWFPSLKKRGAFTKEFSILVSKYRGQSLLSGSTFPLLSLLLSVNAYKQTNS